MAKSKKKTKKAEVVVPEAVDDLRNIAATIDAYALPADHTIKFAPMLEKVVARVYKIADGLEKAMIHAATKDERVAAKKAKLQKKLAEIQKQLSELED